MVWVDSDPEIPNPNLQLPKVQSNIYKRSQETSQEPKPVIAQISLAGKADETWWDVLKTPCSKK